MLGDGERSSEEEHHVVWVEAARPSGEIDGFCADADQDWTRPDVGAGLPGNLQLGFVS